MALFSYDINEDGVKELIVGWASGKVGALFAFTSATVCRTDVQFTVSVAQLVGENIYTYIQYITALSDCLNYLC